MNMSGQDSSDGSLMPMSGMAMTFFTSTSTPLFSDSWVPNSIGSYAGTCIFLIALAVIFRGLLALKAGKEHAWLNAEFNRRYVVVAGKGTKAESISLDGESKICTLSENGVEEEVMVIKKKNVVVRPWRWGTDPIRAVMDTVIAGVAYLLMLAVMTMNVGYFLSVLAGTFLGSLAIGRYSIAYEHEH